MPIHVLMMEVILLHRAYCQYMLFPLPHLHPIDAGVGEGDGGFALVAVVDESDLEVGAVGLGDADDVAGVGEGG